MNVSSTSAQSSTPSSSSSQQAYCSIWPLESGVNLYSTSPIIASDSRFVPGSYS